MGAFGGDSVKPTTLWSNKKEMLEVFLSVNLTDEDRARIQENDVQLATRIQAKGVPRPVDLWMPVSCGRTLIQGKHV